MASKYFKKNINPVTLSIISKHHLKNISTSIVLGGNNLNTSAMEFIACFHAFIF